MTIREGLGLSDAQLALSHAERRRQIDRIGRLHRLGATALSEAHDATAAPLLREIDEQVAAVRRLIAARAGG